MAGLLFVTDKNSSRLLSARLKAGQLRRVYHGIYTQDLKNPMEQIVRNNWMAILAHIVRRGILSYRTAFTLKPTPDKTGQAIVFVTSTYVHTITLPGLIIKVFVGDNINNVEQVLPNLAKSNEARMLLENLTVVKSSALKGVKCVDRIELERYLAKALQIRSEGALNKIREDAKLIATALHLEREYLILNKIISALLNTNHAPDFLESTYARSIAKNEPYDSSRLQSFSNLSTYLRQCIFKDRPYKYAAQSFKNIAFFESYFSNYIEGTEFLIDEAEEIVFANREIYQRHADSHDILMNFRMADDYLEMNIVPTSEEHLIEIIQARHAYLMSERPSINPGKFKTKMNKAGNTFFVAPDEVIGTLCQGFKIYETLNPGMPRALFMHFLISEVHPFDDGNGRLSRMMMNAELVATQQNKIIIPTVFRDGYMSALRLASRDHIFNAYCKAMDIAQAYVSTIDWLEYAESRAKLEADLADKHTDDGLMVFNSAVRQLILSDLAR